MKKIVLMLLALVVVGNVFGDTWDTVELDVVQVILSPVTNTLFPGEGGIFFTNKVVAPSASDWFVFNVKIEDDLTGIQAAVLAMLTKAQANSLKVQINGGGANLGVGDSHYRSFSAIKLIK